MRVMITGANRGIGLAMTKVHAERGDDVHATARDLDQASELLSLARSQSRVHVHQLDVCDGNRVSALARELSASPLDRLVNNAGIASPWETLEQFDPELARRVFETNSIAPVVVTRAFVESLTRGKGRAVFHLSSRMGSIADNSSGQSYAYRMSKAALNMASKTLALDLAPRISSIALHPGWVRTDMGGPSAPVSVDESAAKLVTLMDRLGMKETGSFYSFDGAQIPW